jgi:hypothetical protein
MGFTGSVHRGGTNSTQMFVIKVVTTVYDVQAAVSDSPPALLNQVGFACIQQNHTSSS